MANDMGMEIDDAPIRDVLTRLKGLGGNMERVMRNIGRAMVTSTRLRFRTGTAPDGSKWMKSKRVLAHGGQTLRLTSRLERSFVSRAVANAVAWGTNVGYARPLHFGSKKTSTRVRPHPRMMTVVFGRRVQEPRRVDVKGFTRKVNLPARPILGLSQADRQVILNLAQDEIRQVQKP